MPKIRFTDNTELEYISAFAYRGHSAGYERNMIEFTFNGQISDVGNYLSYFSDSSKYNPIVLVMDEDEGFQEYVHEDYTMLIDVSGKNETINPGNNNYPPQQAWRTKVTIGQKTWIEKLIEANS